MNAITALILGIISEAMRRYLWSWSPELNQGNRLRKLTKLEHALSRQAVGCMTGLPTAPGPCPICNQNWCRCD